MRRRDILKTIALGGAATVIRPFSSFGSFDVLAQTSNADPTGPADLVAVLGGEPAEMLDQALYELGGIGRFVRTGNKVVIKPNIGWDNSPEEAGNSNPELIAALVRHCLEAGAAKVSVLDHTCDQWNACYSNSGIEAAVKAAGGEMLPAHNQATYQEVALPRAKVLKKAKIHRAIMESDAWFNVPILKTHGGAGMTVSMKNLMGIVWDRGYFHWNDLNQCIADICTLPKPPVLNIVDAYRVLLEGGPRGGRGKDVAMAKGLFASPDMVAVDTAAIRFFGQLRAMPLQNIAYLQKGAELAVGTTDLDTLAIKRVKI
ncbi:MAG: DUF362 domain-containing protein [bacterium]|nr:DUF362 domain-containing protein [bacterium]